MHYLLSLVSLPPALYHAIQRFNEGNTSLSAIAQTTKNGVLVRIKEPSNDDGGNDYCDYDGIFYDDGDDKATPHPSFLASCSKEYIFRRSLNLSIIPFHLDLMSFDIRCILMWPVF